LAYTPLNTDNSVNMRMSFVVDPDSPIILSNLMFSNYYNYLDKIFLPTIAENMRKLFLVLPLKGPIDLDVN